MLHVSAGKKAFVWTLIVVAVLANGAGWLLDLWHRISWYDEAVHGFTTFSVSLILALAFHDAVPAMRRHEGLAVLLVLGFGLGLGAAWEIVEWTYEELHAGREQVIPSLDDSMVDLIANGVGALLAGLTTVRMISKGEELRDH